MAEESSGKRHHGETSDKSRTLKGVELHDKETLEIVCTSVPDKVDEMTSRLRMMGGGLYPSFIGVDVEYTSEDEPPQMAAVLHLCVEELFLVYQITAATKWPKRLKQFLQQEKLYTFAGFSIEGDKKMLNKSGLDINPNNFIDMQRKWKVPTTNKFYDSLVDVAAKVIHPFYKGMKQNINKEEDHKLCGTSPLPDNLIEYAGKDAYATYNSWKIINNIMTGWDISQEQEADPYYHCNFAG
ncbi:unnamed protein product [Triticum turgidum subsp. durum]|uniref:3'-5' exonuclease domain-containing protein n=1 Tax=Triticum turgidum subsp. durum TaxID=4567 RepID=A0A9R1QM12_TRITD|nr:unnamed protein product [Triticum turgidum subsp. durum]